MAGYLEHSERWQHHKTPTNRTGHWVGDTFHHGANEPAKCDRCEPSIDYTRPGFERPEETCKCPPCPGRGNDGHGLTHCAECCFGTGVEADPTCPVHGYPGGPDAA